MSDTSKGLSVTRYIAAPPAKTAKAAVTRAVISVPFSPKE